MKNINTNFKSFVNELHADTYANVMDKTGDHAYTSFLGHNDKGDKEGRVNKLARNRFKEEFYNEFPLEATEILTSEGVYKLGAIRFEANHTSYSLMFKNDESELRPTLWIKPEHDGYYIEFNSDEELQITDSESEELIKQMFRYNSMYKPAVRHR